MKEAWVENPPGDWLKAAELGYTSPKTKHLKALENTKQMFTILRAREGVGFPGLAPPQAPTTS